MTSDCFFYPPSRGEFIYENILWNSYTTIEILKKIERFKFKHTDIVITTFPRSGTTLTQEIIWHIKNKNIIKEGDQNGDIDLRFPFLEYNSKFYNPEDPYPIDVLEMKINDPYRLIKTHCPFSFIGSQLYEAKPKCIIVYRNPRDVCVSLYHFYRGMDLFGPWNGTWNEFVEMFLNGFTKCGSWNKWHEEWLTEIGLSEANSLPFSTISKGGLSVLFYSFEMLIKIPKIVIRSIADFLDEPLTESQMNAILHNSNFVQMASDTSLNFIDDKTGFKFIRKGQIGDWKNYLTGDEIEKFQNSIEKKFEELGIKFEYE